MRLLVSAVVMLLSSAGCGPSSARTTSAPPAPAPVTVPAPPPGDAGLEASTRAEKRFRVGERAEAPDYALEVESVRECKPTYHFSKPRPENFWLGIELVVESTSDTRVWASPFHAKLVDAEGVSYRFSMVSTRDCDPGLMAGELDKHQRAVGWVIFEVPQDARAFELLYNPMLTGEPQLVRFELGLGR
jgi:hypothetical protein